MTTTNVPLATTDGYITSLVDVDWATARATSSASDATANIMKVGVYHDGTFYNIYRAFVEADTSEVGAGGTVTSATLYVRLDHGFFDADSKCQVYRAAWSSPISGAVEANYDAALAASTLEGALYDTADALPSTGDWLSVALDPAGINKTGTSQYILISDLDHDNIDPGGGSNYADLRTMEYASTTSDPYIELVYTVAATGQPTNTRAFGVPFARTPGFGGNRIGG